MLILFSLFCVANLEKAIKTTKKISLQIIYIFICFKLTIHKKFTSPPKNRAIDTYSPVFYESMEEK